MSNRSTIRDRIGDMKVKNFVYLFQDQRQSTVSVVHIHTLLIQDCPRRAEECPKSRQINCADISITECLHKFKTTKCNKLQF